jgi:membrane protein YqaA with SNARE-associated domain
MKKRNNRLILTLIFIASTAVLLVPLFFRQQLGQMQSLGLLGLFLINFFSSATLFVPTPGVISVAVASKLYPAIFVALFGALGSSLGELVGFYFGKTGFQILNGKQHKILYHLNKFIFEKYGFFILFFVALIPNPIVDGLGILAGIAGYPVYKFYIPVFLGRLLRNLIIAYSLGGRSL